MVTRKRKSPRTPGKSKKVKSEDEKAEEDKTEKEANSPLKDEQTAAAEALKALSKASDVEGVEGNVNGTTDAACENGNCGTDSSDEAKRGKEGGPSTKEKVSSGGTASAKTVDPTKHLAKASVVTDPKPSTKSQPAASAPVATAAPPAQSGVPSGAPIAVEAEATVEETGEVSSLYVGRVIGRGGEMIRDLQARSGCRIDVDQNVPQGAPRIVTYRGTRSAIAFARQLVARLCTEKGKDADLPLGQAKMRKVQVPGTVIGKIIGRGGEMIRKLQSESQAKIQVDHSGAGMDANHRQVTITGTNESVVKAEEMIMFLCANPAVDAMQALHMLIRDKTQGGGVWGSGPPYPNLPNQGQGMPEEGATGGGYQGGGGYGQASAGYGGYDGQMSDNRYGPSGGGGNAMGSGADIFPCAKTHMGRVIGQKGVTINDLQKRSGCDIQINQNVPAGQDCQISIKGSREGIEMVKQMLQDIIDLGSNHPYAGGHGQFGRGQQGGQQGYQQPSYQGGYASQGHQPQAYSHQQYGMPQQQYGGQPMYQQSYQGQYGMHPGVPQAQPSPWRAATAADGQIYYYNQITQETQWERPAGMP